jgi:ATP-dependent Lon protease
VIYQNGVIGKVVRIVPRKDKTYDVGIQFITREEKNLTNIYPKIHFLKDLAEVEEQPSEEELEEEAVVEEIKEEGGQSEDENQEEL